MWRSFNTDDGIRRAAINEEAECKRELKVSIPMTVLGGLQCSINELEDEWMNEVSIPMTVLGGLQSIL